MGAAVSVVDVDADGLPDLYVTNSREGSNNRLYRNRGDGTFEDVAGAAGHRRRESVRTAASRWARSGATTTTTATKICCCTAGAAPISSTTTGGRAFTRVTTAGLPAWANINSAVWFDFDRDGRLDLFLGGYYSRARQSLEARGHEDDAGELRVRDQRRTQVPVSQSRRRPVRGGQRAGRPGVAPLGARGGRGGSARLGLSRISSSPTTTACRSCSSTRAAASAKWDARRGSGTPRRAA